MKLQIESIYKVLQNQSEYLSKQSENLITTLNQIFQKSGELIQLHQPKAFIFMNEGQDSFDITFTIYDAKNDLHRLMEFEMDFNDGTSFGIEDFPYEVENYPTEDYFSVIRSEYLNKLFFEWFMECLWNSDLIKLEVPLIFSMTHDLDELTNLKDGLGEYTDLAFLD